MVRDPLNEAKIDYDIILWNSLSIT